MHKNNLYAKVTRERKRLAKKQKSIEIKKDKEIQDKEKFKSYNFFNIYCDLD